MKMEKKFLKMDGTCTRLEGRGVHKNRGKVRENEERLHDKRGRFMR